jgi:hypothetical protein
LCFAGNIYSQSFPPENTSCTSKILNLFLLTTGGIYVILASGTSNQDFNINYTTGSVRTSFAFWGKLEIYSGTDGSLISSVDRTGCGGPIS